MIATPTDIDVMARTLWGEARGEPLEGQIAVAWVIRNRAQFAQDWCIRMGRTRHPLFGNGTLASVCQAPEQFSCWTASDPNWPKLTAFVADDSALTPFRQIAQNVIASAGPSPVVDATHYAENSILAKGLVAWARKAEKVATIGHHTFFRAVP